MILLNIGFDNYIAANEVVAIRDYDNKRLQEEIKSRQKQPTDISKKIIVHDCRKKSSKERAKSCVVVKSGECFLSSLSVDTLVKRLSEISK